MIHARKISAWVALVLLLNGAIGCGKEEAGERPGSFGKKAEHSEEPDAKVASKIDSSNSAQESEVPSEVNKEDPEPAGALGATSILLDCGARMEWLKEEKVLATPLRDWVRLLEEHGLAGGFSVRALHGRESAKLKAEAGLSLDSPYSNLCLGRFEHDATRLAAALGQTRKDMASLQADVSLVAVVTDGAPFRERSVRQSLAKELSDAAGLWIGFLPVALSGRHYVEGASLAPGQHEPRSNAEFDCGVGNVGGMVIRPTTGEPAFLAYEGDAHLAVVVALYEKSTEGGADAGRAIGVVDETLREALLNTGDTYRLFPLGGVSGECNVTGSTTSDTEGIIVTDESCAVHCDSPRAKAEVRWNQRFVRLENSVAGTEGSKLVLLREDGEAEEWETDELVLKTSALSIPVSDISLEQEPFKLADKAADKANLAVSLISDGVVQVDCAKLRKWRCANPKRSVPYVTALGKAQGIQISGFELPTDMAKYSTADWDVAPCRVPALSELARQIMTARLEDVSLPFATPIAMKIYMVDPGCESTE